MSEGTSTHSGPQAPPPSTAIGWKHPQSAIRHGPAHLCLWTVAVAGLAVDLWSKAWAFGTLVPGETRPWIPHVLDFQLSRNPGALFGMGPGMVPLFIIASIAALGFVIYMFAGSFRTQRTVHVALALILAGALGNLYDRTFEQFDMVQFRATSASPAWRLIGRVVGEPTDDTVAMTSWVEPDRVRTFRRGDLNGPVQRVGVVRDFLKIVWKVGDKELWPWIFNVADVLLVVGVGLLLIGFWGRPHPGDMLSRLDDATGPAQ